MFTSPALSDNSTETPHFGPKQNFHAGSEEDSESSNIKITGSNRSAYAPEQLYNAVEAVAAGEISNRKASKKFGVKKETIRKSVRENIFSLTDLEEL